MTAPTQSTIAQINRALHKLSEADRQRILRFSLGIVSDREGKRRKRSNRFMEQAENDSWRIGNG